MRSEHSVPSLKLFFSCSGRVFERAGYYLAVLLLMTMPSLAQNHNRHEICVKVEKVGESAGFWSGIAASTQWLDAKVIATSSKDFKVGDRITFGLYVVKGDKFADSKIPQLNPRIIFPGVNLTLDTKDSCRADGSTGWVYSCVKVGCSKRASGDRQVTGYADPSKPK